MDSLPKLPKLNKTQFISSFVATQQANAKSYAEEGRVAALTWQLGSDTSKTNRHSKSIANPGFATPVLKPRKRLWTENQMKEQPLATESHLDPAHSKKTSRIVHNKKTQKRQVMSDDDDKLARLAERRTRKRAKREIVRPESPDTSPELNTTTKRSKSSAKGRGRRAIDGVPALALMHGFSASNIGKNRLTLQMNANKSGVFNKGKASSKIHLQRGKRKTAGKNIGLAFSEKRFLNIASTPSVKPKHSRVSSSCTGSVPDSTSTTQARSSKGQVANNVLSDTSSDDVVSQNMSKSYTEPAGSDVWDIENDGFKLPSVVSESKSVQEQKLDTCQAEWNRQMQRDELDRGNATSSPSLSRSNDGLRRPSSSIAPSQSASHYRPLRKAQSLATSKYFRFPPACGEGLVHETPQFHQSSVHEQPPSSTYPIDHNALGNSTSHEEFESHSPIKGYAHTSLVLNNSAQNEIQYVPMPPADEPQNFYHPTPGVPHFSDADLSHLGYSVQKWAYSPGSTSNNEILIGDAVFVDMNYDDIWYHPEGTEVGTGFDDQSLVYHDHGYLFHDDSCEVENDAQPEMWEAESYNWEGEVHLRSGVEEYTGSTLEEGWDGEIKDDVDYESSDDLETSCYQAGFHEGRELLLGLPPSSKWDEVGLPSMGLATVEADVVANMKSHWRPQKL